MNAETTTTRLVQTLGPKQLKAQLLRCMKAALVAIVRSSPGMGKTEIGHSIGDEHNLKVLDFRLGQADITDFNGLPYFVETTGTNGKQMRAEFIPFMDFPLEGDTPGINPKTGKPYAGWLLIFDEITSAPKQLQAAAYKILLERRVGQYKLHPNVVMLAFGNEETDNAVVHPMSTALQSRLVHLTLRVDNRDWIDWAIENNVDKRIIAFIEFKPSNLHRFDPNHGDHTFACPRTWWFTHLLIKDTPHLSVENDMALLQGTISPGVAMEFISFCDVFEQLPTLDSILAAPKTVNIPYEPSVRFALGVMLAEQFNKNTANALMEFVQRLPVEVRVLCLRMVTKHSPEMIQHPALISAMQALVRM
jgi:hypothetical protein